MTPDAEELAGAMDDVAARAVAAAGIGRPPVDAVAVARALDMVVALHRGQPQRARRVTLAARAGGVPQNAILVGDEPRPERRQWSVAHEIGEHLAHRVFDRLSLDPREADGMREHVANGLAGRLLLPTAWFRAEATACHWDLAHLKQCFATASHELIARRMLDFPPRIIISIFDQGQLGFRRSNWLARDLPLSSSERACWQQVHETARPAATPVERPHVFGWPIHEAAWKREILRTALDPYNG